MTKENQCEFCLYYAFDEDYEEHYCSLNLDQDQVEKLQYSRYEACPYFRMGDDYTIVKKQGF